MQITKNIYLTASLAPWTEEGYLYHVFDFKPEGYDVIAESEHTFEVEEGHDYVAGQVEILRQAIAKVEADAYLAKVKLDEQINSLLAIEDMR
jgi:hypothetical protein